MDYTAQVSTARRLITKYGDLNCVYLQFGQVDPVQPNIPMVWFADTRISLAFQALMKDMDIPQGNTNILIPGDIGFTPTNRDLITRSTGEGPYIVDDFTPLNPGGTVILYSIALKI